ncbi:MAG: nucleotidyl transferase AbiEii/AbiGii toxin family protein [Nitrospirota bacterium]
MANDAYLTAVIRVLQAQHVDFALAGGLAYSALVTPRATVDIDVLILMPTRPPTDLFEGLRAALPGRSESS